MKCKKNIPYSLWSNLKFVLKKTWFINKSLIIAAIIQMQVMVILPLLSALLLKYIVALVTDHSSVNALVEYTLILSGFILLLNMLNDYCSAKIGWQSISSRFSYLNLCSEKVMDTDYENIERPQGQIKLQKAMNAVSTNRGGTEQIFHQLVDISSNAIGLITYSAVIIQLSPWIVILLFGMTCASYFANQINLRWIQKNKNSWVSIERKLSYIQNQASNFGAAKDIRIYRMINWFQELFSKILSNRIGWKRKEEKRGFITDSFSAIIALFRDGVSYSFLIYEVIFCKLTPADFILYFTLISQYSNWMVGLLDSYNALQTSNLGFCDLRDFLCMPDNSNRGKGAELPNDSVDIKFQNVSYQYPESSHSTLRNLNFTIKPGEKIAIVGLNGAGKTTLVKLLCGLYKPSEGNIFVAGKSIVEYNRDDYFRLISVVFQDILLLPVSIAKNIALCPEKKIDKERLNKALKLSGLYNKVQNLPEKENTPLLKGVQNNAVELSGGEKQSLALSRAIYKGGKIIILDEPTAALDPIAENKMYLKYNELTAGTTSIFISHRLSSTRFCDRIIFLEGGQVVEEGTHEELMKQKGKYAELFEIQSRYYKNSEAVVNDTIEK